MRYILLLFLLFSNIFALNEPTSKIEEDKDQHSKTYLFLGNIDYEPFLFEQNKKSAGIIYDLVQEIAKASNIKIEVKLMNWAKAQEQMRQGHADGLLQLNINEDRKKYLDFSKQVLKSDFMIYKKNTTRNIYTLEDLNDKVVGVEAKGYPISLLKKNPKAKVKIINSWKDGFSLLDEGKIDAVIADKLVGDYTLHKFNFTNIDYSNIPLESSFSHFAVAKGNKELLNKINSGLEKIRIDKTYQSILNKWSGKDLLYLTKQELNSLLLGNMKSEFTTEEKEYLSKNPVIKVAHSPHSAPNSFIDDEGKISGIYYDFYKYLGKKYNINFEFKLDTWKNVIEKLENNEIDIIPGMSKKLAQSKDFLFTNGLINNPLSAFINKNNPIIINSLEDLEGKKVGFNKNIKFLNQYLNENYKNKFLLTPFENNT